MEREKIKRLLEDVRGGKLEVGEAMEALRSLPYQDLGFAKLDTHRDLRRGFPEVIFCQGKSLEHIEQIVENLLPKHDFIMATRADPTVYQAIKKIQTDAVYHSSARIVLIGERKKIVNKAPVLVVSAGTADIPVAEESAVTAEALGNTVERLFDIGVAGIHRLLSNQEKLRSASVIIVVAGMDGALPSIVAGFVDQPVIAVPTSVGYGASFGGLSALLTMLNSCAPGVAVMNIDNGFGAGYFAAVINCIGSEE